MNEYWLSRVLFRVTMQFKLIKIDSAEFRQPIVLHRNKILDYQPTFSSSKLRLKLVRMFKRYIATTVMYPSPSWIAAPSALIGSSIWLLQSFSNIFI